MRSWLVVVVLFGLVAGAIGEAAAVGKITEDPNVGGAAEQESVKKDPLALDKRLDRRVTYWSANECVSSILTTLGELAGVKFYCGQNNDDWQVRDRKMNVFATDVPLRDLMRSIARVMKFRWRVNDEKSPWTYRLYMVRPELLEALALLREQEREYERRMAEKRAAFLDKCAAVDSLPEADVEKLKETDPAFHLDVKAGTASAFARFLREAPRFKDAFLAGGSLNVKASELPPAAQQAMFALIRGISNREDGWKRIGRGSESWGMSEDIEKRVGDLLVLLSTWTDVSKSPEFPGMVLGGMYVMTDDPDTHWVIDREAFFPFVIHDTQCERERMQAKLELEALEQNKRWYDLWTEQMRADLDAAAATLRQALPGEPPMEHPEDAALLGKVDLEPESDHLAEVELALADASGFAVVSDDFGASTACVGGIPKGELTVRQALDRIATAYNYNWDKRGNVLEFRDRQWFRKRSFQLPEAWLAKWRKTYRETGTLDLADLAQLAKLDREQYRANLSQDKVLGDAALRGIVFGGNLTVEMCAVLNDDQRAAMFSEGGLDLGVFCADPKLEIAVTRPMVSWFLKNRSIRTAKGKRLYCARVKKGRAYEYTFRAVADDPNLEPLEWKLTTPEYKEPERPEKP